MKYYAIANGKKTGIFTDWNECKSNILGFSNAKYKSFKTKDEAQAFLDNYLQKSDLLKKKTKIKEPKKNTLSLEADYPDAIKVYTDGSLVRKNGNLYCGYGIYIPDKSIEKSYVLNGKKTNNRAELSAIIDAITILNQETDKTILICTDSSYSIKIFGETGEKYKSKNFIKKGNEEYPNRDLVEKALELKHNRLKFRHVRSHTNKLDEYSIGNDIADKLAVQGATKDYVLQNKNNLGEYKLSFGKYKNQSLNFLKHEDIKYLVWIVNSRSFEELCIKKENFRLEKEIVRSFLYNIQ